MGEIWRIAFGVKTLMPYAFVRSYVTKIWEGTFDAPHLDVSDHCIHVGENWLNDSQWSRLIALRIDGDIRFHQKHGYLIVSMIPATGGVFNNIRPLGGFSVSVDHAMKSLNNFGSIMGTIDA